MCWLAPSLQPCLAGCSCSCIARVVTRSRRSSIRGFADLKGDNTQEIGKMLYGAYMFPFEIASLLLLVAIVGAVVMAKKRI